MANHKSCIKRILTNEKSRVTNRAENSRLRTLLRRVEKASGEEAIKLAKQICSFADKAFRHGIIHRKRAARIKSSVQRKSVAPAT